MANNVEIHIPVPSDVDSPSFKTSIGTVRYIPDQASMNETDAKTTDETRCFLTLQDCIVWSIKQFQGHRLKH